jgi:2-C-methyl-D-erythritol 4-phosphate cytidylyltransferase
MSPLIDTVKVDEDGNVVAPWTATGSGPCPEHPPGLRDLILRAHDEITADVTDDAAMVEMLGVRVKAYEGRKRNIRITTPDDLHMAERTCNEWTDDGGRGQ